MTAFIARFAFLRRSALLAALGLAAIGFASQAEARVIIGVGIGIPLGYPAPYYYGPAPAYYAPAPVVYAPARTVVVTPDVQAAQSEVVYQYYCAPTRAYYPAVPTCTEPWTKVLPNGQVAR